MELVGILFSVPGAFVASVVYRYLILFASGRWPRIKPVFMLASCFVLALMITEWILLAVRGAVETRVAIGPAYYIVHSVIFFLGTPAVLNLLVLPNASKWRDRWWSSVLLCTALAFILVVQQYVVYEALYGIDGASGPFGQIDRF